MNYVEIAIGMEEWISCWGEEKKKRSKGKKECRGLSGGSPDPAA